MPTKDITYVKLLMGRDKHALEIQGAGGKVLKRLSGYGREVSGYQIGLMGAIRSRHGATFDRERLPNVSTIMLGVFLLMPMAIACSGLEIARPIQKKDHWDV